MNKTKPVRVSRENHCPICGKSDWCMIGDAYVLCMRVQSEKPKSLAGGETGWLHSRGESPPPKPDFREPERPVIRVADLLGKWKEWSTGEISVLSANLGVSARSLDALQVVRAPYKDTWAFPMRYGDNSYSGIRLRNLRGEKWAERGSHQGLFIPQVEPCRRVFIVEGPTDCAAALTVGYYAIGRPSCCGGVEQIRTFIQKRGINQAVIVSDLDDPGLRGAKGLQELLPISTCILVCPAKDMRTFVQNGGSREMIESMVGQLIWKN